MLLEGLSALTLLTLLYQCLSHTYVYFGLRRAFAPLTKPSESAMLPPISVIIAARNAAALIQSNLPSIFSQDYPQFEVIVVNDRSSDNSSQVLDVLQSENSTLRVASVTGERQGFRKKQALAEGIKIASFGHLVFLDVDCVPAGKQWLRAFGNRFAQGDVCILGTGLFHTQPGLLNALYQHESIRVASLYHAAGAHGRPYMGVGRSLAYSKNAFDSVGGFDSHQNIPSGDDDLMVQAIARKSSVTTAPLALTLSYAPARWKDWIHQKTRHLGAGKAYPAMTIFLLALNDISAFIMWILMVPALLCSPPWLIVVLLALFVCRGIFLLRSYRWFYQMGQGMPSVPKLFYRDFLLSLLNPILSVASQVRRD